MTSLLKLFGGQTKQPRVNPQQTIESLRGTIEMLEKRENYLETRILKEIQIAKANATKKQTPGDDGVKKKECVSNSN